MLFAKMAVRLAAVCILLGGCGNLYPKFASADSGPHQIETNVPKRFGSTSLRMSDEIRSIHWTPDGRRIIAVDENHNVRAWSVPSGKLEKAIFRGGILNVAVFADGERIAAGSDLEILVVDIQTGTVQCRIEDERAHDVQHFALLDGGKRLVSNFGREAIAIWDTKTGRQLLLLDEFKRIHLIAAAPDSKHIAAVSYGKSLHVIDTKTGKEIWKKKFDSDIRQVAYSQDSKRLATISGDHAVRIIDAVTGDILHALTTDTPDEMFVSFEFSPSNETIIIGESSGVLRVLNRTTGKQLRRFSGVSNSTETLAISPKGDLLAAGGHHEVIYLFDLKTGKLVAPLEDGHAGTIYSVAFSKDGKKVITGGKDRLIRIWDKEAVKELKRLEGHEWHVRCQAVHPDGKTLISCGSYDEAVRFWDIESGRQIDKIPAQSQRLHSLALSPDGGTLAFVDNKHIHIWDTKLKKDRFAPLKLPNLIGGLDCLCFMNDNSAIVVRGRRDVSFLDPADGRLIRQATLQNGADIKSIAVSPDGRYLALSYYQTIDIWEIATMQMVRHCYGSSTAYKPTVRTVVTHLVLLNDGRVISGGENGCVLIWTLWPEPKPQILGAHSGAVTALAVSPDETELLSGSTDTTASLWKIPPLPKKVEAKTELTDEQVKEIWLDLKSSDAEKAHRALWKASDHPKQTLLMLERNFEETKALDPAIVRAIIADLASNRFAVRQQAFDKLAALDTLVVPALKERLKQKPEQNERDQIEKLLKATEAWTGDRLRELRAVQCVEMIGTPEAKKLLDKWSKGPADARLTKEAKLAAERLAKRP